MNIFWIGIYKEVGVHTCKPSLIQPDIFGCSNSENTQVAIFRNWLSGSRSIGGLSINTLATHVEKMCFLVLETYYVICLLDAWWRHGKSLFVSDYWFCTHKVISFIGISWPTSYYDVVLCTLTQCNLWLIDRLEKAIMISKISSLVIICLLLKSLYISHTNHLINRRDNSKNHAATYFWQ